MENKNIINNVSNIRPIKTLNELLAISKEVKKIMQQMNEINEDPNIERHIKKMLRISLQKKIDDNLYLTRLVKGISIVPDVIINQVINMVIDFLKEKGYDNETLINRLKNIKFYVSDIPLITNGGILDNVNSLVGIDYHYCIFDKDGNFVSLDEEKKDILIHALSHEFFHDLSRAKKDQPLSEALNEGMTDMFAHQVSKKHTVNTILSCYSFIEKVCQLLTFLVGFDKVFMDYINDPIKLECICDLFNECDKNKDEYLSFKNVLDKFLQLKQKKADTYQIEKQIAIYLKHSIIIPYIKKHSDLTQEVIEKYNTIFGNYEPIKEEETEKNKVN